MSGFPSLQPAFTVRVDIDAPMQVGGQHGAQLVIVPMVSGTVKSEEGFEPKLDGELHGVGYDYIHNDADGGNMRLDVRSQVKNHDGTVLAMYYKGTVKLTQGVGKVLSGAPDAKTTDYGDSFVNFSFETGNEKYKELQNGTYVAAGHFVTGEGKPGVVVEYKVNAHCKLTSRMPALPQPLMGSAKRYTAAMFDKHYEDENYFGFETLVDPNTYNIQVKAYMDKNRCRLQDYMVLVGTYHTHFGRQKVWARPTGLEVEYYHGLPEALELARVDDLFENRIYYVPPFSYMSTSQNTRMKKERLYGMKVVETVVNVVFLKQGWLVHFEVDSDTDALEAFKCSSGGLPSPRVKTEPTDEDSSLFQPPAIPNRDPQTQADFPTRKGGTPTPGLSHSPIRRPPAPITPRRRQPPTYAQTQAYEADLRTQLQQANRAREQDRLQLQQAEERIRELEGILIAMGGY
ncbi:hypothetical protein AA0121_g4883 [Alternaria tenuissima]|nr:hypothetical protein AA0121_g4883 [Alternaria tenuissima]